MAVGSDVGSRVGLGEGASDGTGVGVDVGGADTVGAADPVGAADGLGDGAELGADDAVGTADGVGDGSDDGSGEGCAVGACVVTVTCGLSMLVAEAPKDLSHSSITSGVRPSSALTMSSVSDGDVTMLKVICELVPWSLVCLVIYWVLAGLRPRPRIS